MKTFCMPILLAALIILCGCAKGSVEQKQENPEAALTAPDASTAAPAGEETKSATPAEEFEIWYDGAGLTQIHVLPGKVDYEWHTLKNGLQQVPQSMDAFDAHSATITPNAEELAALLAWLKKYDFAGFKNDYPPRDPGDYGAAWQYSLSIKVGNDKYSMSWTSDSNTPAELNKAVDELENVLKRAKE
jgi:hypothetical protein